MGSLALCDNVNFPCRSLWPDLEVDNYLSEEFVDFSTTSLVNDMIGHSQGKVVGVHSLLSMRVIWQAR